MTIAQQIEQKGIQKGLQQGLEREKQKTLAIARNLLSQNVPISIIRAATGLSGKKLNWKMFKAD